MKLPEIKRIQPPQWQKDRLARWLAEWEIDNALRSPKTDEHPTPAPEQSTVRGAASNDAQTGLLPRMAELVQNVSQEPQVQAGQIRLLSPVNPGARNRPMHVAILREQSRESFLVAPFGRFFEPATPGELLTGRKVPCLRILCIWNACDLHVKILGKSWVVDEMSKKELDEALAVHRNINVGDKLPDELEKRVGPPISHWADPRREYLDEESATMSAVRESGVVSWPYELEERRELPKAAEPHAPYGTDSATGSEEPASDPDGDGDDER